MDLFHLCLAIVPIACYLIFLGAVNLRSRPWVVSGGFDRTALGLAVSGMIFVGPLALLVPSTTVASLTAHGNKFIWSLLFAGYVLSITLVLLNLRPRIVIYNISPEQLRSILPEISLRLDDGTRWAGDCLALPSLGVQLHLETHTAMRNVSLLAAGRQQDIQGWIRLQKELSAALLEVESPGNRWGPMLMCAGTLMLAALAVNIMREPMAFMQAAKQMF